MKHRVPEIAAPEQRSVVPAPSRLPAMEPVGRILRIE
jgi:hypothetical protein